MACWTWLRSSAYSHPLLPFFNSPRILPPPSYLRRVHRFISSGRLISTPNRFKPLPMEVHAQAKRGFSFKQDEAATPADLNFKAPLKIVEYPDPILRARNKRIDTFDDNLKKLVDEMFDVMYK